MLKNSSAAKLLRSIDQWELVHFLERILRGIRVKHGLMLDQFNHMPLFGLGDDDCDDGLL